MLHALVNLGLRYLLGLVILALAQGSALAEPRKLAFSDLTESQEKQLWERANRYADYAALLKHCSMDVQFEARIRAEAQPCIEAETLDKVATFFRRQLNRAMRTYRADACRDPGFVERGLAEKIRLTLDDQVKAVRTLCTHYQRTGIYRTER